MSFPLPDWFCRRTPFRLLQRLGLHGVSSIGSRRIVTPLHDPAALAWLYWRSNWKSELLARLLRHSRGTLLDVGANAGQTYADFLSTGVDCRYVGFEPNPRCLAFLGELLHLNPGLDAAFVPCGLAANTGLAELHFDTADPIASTASILRESRPDAFIRREWIFCAKLDDIASPLALGPVALVKIDVEGAELEAIQGMVGLLAASQPPVLCEVLLRAPEADPAIYAVRTQALAAALRGLGYQIHRIRKSRHLFTGLEPVSAFPEACWTVDLAESCDYLFLPADYNLLNLN